MNDTFKQRAAIVRARRSLALCLLALALAACGSAPPAPPRQVQEYNRHTAVGLEKHADGFVGEARNAFRRALTHAELDDSPERIAGALLNLGASELLLGDAEAAGQAFARAAREAGHGREPGLEWQALAGLAEATRRLGEPAQAVALYERLPATGRPTASAAQWSTDIAQALALAEAGRPTEGLALLARVEPAVRGSAANSPLLGNLLLTRARILLLQREWASAREAALGALENDRQLHHPPSVADDHYWLGLIAQASGDPASAGEHLNRAARIFARTGQTRRLAAAQDALARR